MALKPVELEILVKGENGLKEAKEGTDALLKSTKAYTSELGNFNAATGDMSRLLEAVRGVLGDVAGACQSHEAAIERLKAEYMQLNAQIVRGVSEGGKEEESILAKQQAIQGEITVRRSLLTSLREGSSELETAVAAQEKQVSAERTAEAQHESLRTKIRALKQEMADARLNGIDEQSEAYKRLAAELGRLQDVQSDISRQGSILSNDQSRFAGIVSGLRGVTAAFTAAQGAMAIFGGENEKLQETMAKLQSLMYITISLQQVSEVLNKDSAFRLVTLTNLRQWWNNLLAAGRGETVAATAAETAETAAITAQTAAVTQNTAAKAGNNTAQAANTVAATAGTAANIGLAGAFRMVGAAVKSIPVFGWIAAAIGAIATAVIALKAHTAKAREEAEAFYKSVAEQTYQPIGALKQLQTAWNDLGDDLEAKEKFIEDNKSAFDKLNVSVDNVQDAENLMVNNAQAFIDAQIAKAKATILLQQAMDKEKDLAQLELDITDMPDTRRTIATFWSADEKNTAKLAKQAQADKLRAELDPLYKQINDYEQAAAKALSGAGIKTKTSTAVTKAAATARQTKNNDREVQEQQRAAQRLSDEMLALEKQNQQTELDLMEEGAEKKLAKIDADYNARMAEIQKKAAELAELNKQAGVDNTDGQTGLTQEQQDELEEAAANAAETKKRAEEELQKAELQAMADYLKEYGTFQQQKLAIAQEYDEKIAKADNEWSRKSLEAQKAEALEQVEVNAIKQTIDWGSIFGSFATMFKDESADLVEKLRAIANSKDFNEKASLEDQQTIHKLIAELQKGEGWDSQIFNKIADDMTRYQSAMQNLIKAQDKEKEAADQLAQAQERLAQARTGGDQKAIDAAQKEVEEWTEKLSESGAKVQEYSADVSDSSQDVQAAAQQAIDQFQGFAASIAGLKSNSLQGIGSALMSIDKMFNNGNITKAVGSAIQSLFSNQSVTDSLSTALGASGDLYGAIISAILSVLDTLKDGIGPLVTNVMDQITDAVGGILSNLWSSLGDIFVSNVKGIGSMLGGVVNALTFGLFGGGETDKSLTDDMESLSYSNEALKNSIDALKDTMTDNSKTLTENKEAYQQALTSLQVEESSTQSIMERAGKNHNTGLFNSDHSSNHYVNKNMTAADWEAVSEAAGVAVSSASEFWTLTSEQMYNVSINAAEQYAKIKQYADDGHSDAAQYMDDYISYYTQLNELNEEWVETLTGISFDDMYDDFIDAISDMDVAVDDLADNMEEKLQKAIINAMVSQKYSEKLKAIYDSFGDYMDGDNFTLTAQQYTALLDDYTDIITAAREDVESLYAAYGWDTSSSSSTSQTGKTGTYAALTQEQGTKLEGLDTNILMHCVNLDANVEQVALRMSMVETHLAKIVDNTGLCSDSLQGIAENIVKIVRDGIKVK